VAEEIELKLTASPAVLATVPQHPAIEAAARGRARTMHMLSTYYDTPGRELAAAGVALRLRRAGGRWLQTVKGAGSAVGGLHRRAEFEWRLARPRLDTAKLARTPWRRLLAQHAPHCKAIFATEFQRRAQPLTFADGTRATLAIDVGEIRAGRRRAPLSEAELELERGDPARLFDLAAALLADLPARVSAASKAERGYALASGRRSAQPRRARPAPLDPEVSVPQALAAIGSECVTQLETNAEALHTSSDPELLHQLRVGWRRLRSLSKLVALVSPSEALTRIESELGWLGEALGPARDCDVFAAETLPRIAAQFRGTPELARLRARVARRRRRLRDTAREALASARFQQLLVALGAFLVSLEQSTAPEASVLARDWIRPLLEKHHRKLRKRSRHIHRLEPAERHRARVAAKKLRYAAEFFAPLFAAKPTQAYIAALSKLQGALGRLNDLAVAAKLADELGPTAELAHARGIVRGWVAAASAAELKRLRTARRRFAQCAPFWQ
jgi:inorganic triphosphatase YgiF